MRLFRTASASALVLAGALWCAFGPGGAANAAPYIEVVGGGLITQDPPWNIIPAGAQGVDNLPSAVSMFLRDPGAAPGTTWGIKFDYIGSDAVFTNLFSAGSVNWCNQGAGCPGGFAQLGNNGPPANSSVWFGGSSPATGYITVPVDGLIPFQFVADFFNQHGNGTHVIANGTQGSVGTAHMGVFNISGGAFDFGGFNSQGTAWAVGLTDGNDTVTDDDHQDFMIRVTVASEPGTLAVLAFGLLALAAAARRRAA